MEQKTEKKLKVVAVCITTFVSLTLALTLAHSALLAHLDAEPLMYGSVADISEDYQEQSDTYHVTITKNQGTGELEVKSVEKQYEKTVSDKGDTVTIKNLEKGDVIEVVTITESGEKNLFKQHEVGGKFVPNL